MYKFKKTKSVKAVVLVLAMAALLAACSSSPTTSKSKSKSTTTTTASTTPKLSTTTTVPTSKPSSSQAALGARVGSALDSYKFPSGWVKQGTGTRSQASYDALDSCIFSAIRLPIPTTAIPSDSFGTSPPSSAPGSSTPSTTPPSLYRLAGWTTFTTDSSAASQIVTAIGQGKGLSCFKKITTSGPTPPPITHTSSSSLNVPAVGSKSAGFTVAFTIKPPSSGASSSSSVSSYTVAIDIASFAKGNLVSSIIAMEMSVNQISSVALPSGLLDNLLTSMGSAA